MRTNSQRGLTPASQLDWFPYTYTYTYTYANGFEYEYVYEYVYEYGYGHGAREIVAARKGFRQ